MKYRALDSNGDYSFGKSMQEFKAYNDAVVQAVYTNLRLLKGEWWEDINEGFPLFQSALKTSGTDDHIKAVDMMVKERILSTTGVVDIVSFESNLEDRKYRAVCSIKTRYSAAVSVEVMF